MKEDVISRVPLFSSLPRREIGYLAETLRPAQLPEQSLLFREGETSDRFYILLEGEVEIIKALGTDDERLLGVRGAGSFIGEMSLFIRDGRRTASVRARTPLHLLEMSRAEFDALLTRQPTLAYDMVRILSLRLNETENRTIQDLQEKNRELKQAYDDLRAAQAQIIEKEKIEAELDVARRIQRSILPREQPQLAGYDFGMLIEPMLRVGGDFYDFIPLSDNRLGIAIGDVSGHGPPAAIFMALTYSLLRAEAARAYTPLEALHHVNRHLLGMNASEMFVTILYGILDPATQEFHYVRAGHDLPLVLTGQHDAVDVYPAAGQVLGLFTGPVLEAQTLVLPPGGLLLLYTDGATESMNAAGQQFGRQGLATVLRAASWVTAQDACEAIHQAVSAHSQTPVPHDDITLVAVKMEDTRHVRPHGLPRPG